MNRKLLILADCLVAVTALAAAFLLRHAGFGANAPDASELVVIAKPYFVLFGLAPLALVGCNAAANLYQDEPRPTDVQVTMRLAASATGCYVLLYAATWLLRGGFEYRFTGYSRVVLAVGWLLTFVLALAVRLVPRRVAHSATGSPSARHGR